VLDEFSQPVLRGVASGNRSSVEAERREDVTSRDTENTPINVERFIDYWHVLSSQKSG